MAPGPARTRARTAREGGGRGIARAVDVVPDRPSVRRGHGPAGAGPGGATRERVLRFLAAMAALCAVASIPGSSAFDIRSVAVTGNQAVPTTEILDRSEVRTGTSVFTVDAYRIGERLRRDPRIAETWVGVALPDRVRIVVRERAPVVALRSADGPVLLDRDGVAIARSRAASGLPVLIVDRLDLPGVQVGTVVPSGDVRLGARITASLPDGLRFDVAGVRVDQGGEIVLYMRDRVAVRVGGADGIGGRIAQVSEVLGAVRARRMRVEYVDLRFPGNIVVKPAGRPALDGAARPALDGAAGPGQENSP